MQRQLPEGLPKRAASDLRLLREFFISRYQLLLARHPWSFLQTWYTIRLVPQYSTGTISLTQASAAVTGSGTSWTSALAFHHLLAASEVPIKVLSVASPTSLTIETAWGQSDQTNIAYKIRQLHLGSGGPEVGSLVAVWWKDRRLVEKTLTFLDSLDPSRVDTGNPVYYSTRGYDAGNGILFEVWPYPTSGGIVRFLALKRPTSPPAMGDEVLFPNEHILEVGVRALVFEYAFAETGQNQWLQLAVANGQQFEKAVGEMVDQDRVTSSWPQSTPDTEHDPSDLDPLTHDTMPL